MFLARLGLGNYGMAELENLQIRAARTADTGGNRCATTTVRDTLEKSALRAMGRRYGLGGVGELFA